MIKKADPNSALPPLCGKKGRVRFRVRVRVCIRVIRIRAPRYLRGLYPERYTAICTPAPRRLRGIGLGFPAQKVQPYYYLDLLCLCAENRRYALGTITLANKNNVKK